MWPYEVNSCNSNFSQSVNLPAQGLRGHLGMISVDFFCRSGEDGHARGRSDEKRRESSLRSGQFSQNLSRPYGDYWGLHFFRSLWTGAFLQCCWLLFGSPTQRAAISHTFKAPNCLCVDTPHALMSTRGSKCISTQTLLGFSQRDFHCTCLFVLPPPPPQYIYIWVDLTHPKQRGWIWEAKYPLGSPSFSLCLSFSLYLCLSLS